MRVTQVADHVMTSPGVMLTGGRRLWHGFAIGSQVRLRRRTSPIRPLAGTAPTATFLLRRRRAVEPTSVA